MNRNPQCVFVIKHLSLHSTVAAKQRIEKLEIVAIFHTFVFDKLDLGRLRVGGQAVAEVLVTQMLQTVDPPKTILLQIITIITQIIFTRSPFLFRASGISQTGWLGCSKVHLATKKEIFGRKQKLPTHRLSMCSTFHKCHKNQR